MWLILFIHNAKAESPTINIDDLSVQEQITYYANTYGVQPQLALAVARCESQFGKLPDGDNGHAKGIYQYWDDTWERHYKEFNRETGVTLTKGVTKDDIQLATWAFSTGKASEWTTAVAIKKGGTYSFYSRQLKQHFTVKCEM